MKRIDLVLKHLEGYLITILDNEGHYWSITQGAQLFKVTERETPQVFPKAKAKELRSFLLERSSGYWAKPERVMLRPDTLVVHHVQPVRCQLHKDDFAFGQWN